MSNLEFYKDNFSDVYKEAHGFRPRHIDTSSWTEEQFKQQFDYLDSLIEESLKREREMEAIAIAGFEDAVKTNIKIGAKDRETAIRWMHEANRTNGDADYLCYCLGLPYGYIEQVKLAA